MTVNIGIYFWDKKLVEKIVLAHKEKKLAAIEGKQKDIKHSFNR